MQGLTPMVAAYSAGMSEGHFCSIDLRTASKSKHTDSTR